MDWQHAYNYWRKVFVESSHGQFDKVDFDGWFRSGLTGPEHSTWFFGVVDKPGSKEHFDVLIQTAFVNMLEVASEGRFK